MLYILRLSSLLIIIVGALITPAFSQDYFASPSPAVPNVAFNTAQIDQLTAPIALYPDTLVGTVLMASTYPLEIVEANRWRQSMGNTQLTSNQLSSSLASQPWDASIKTLVAFPEVLELMDNNLQWTEQLGEAFISQQVDVMNSIQKLRGMALAAGTLTSTPQLQVATDNQSVIIQPTDPNYVYVPSYGPGIYGAWPWQNYQPYVLMAPPGYAYSNNPYITYTPGVLVVGWLWGWNHWDWEHHHLDVDDNRVSRIDHDRTVGSDNGHWHFDPQHRHEVPFHNAVLRQNEVQKRSHDRWEQTRGYAGPAEIKMLRPSHAPATRSLSSDNSIRSNVTPNPTTHFDEQPYPTPSHSTRPNLRQEVAQPTTAPTPVRATSVPVAHVMPPLYESIAHAPQTQIHAQRGYSSRASISQPESVPKNNQSHPQHQQNVTPLTGTMRGHN